MKTNHIPIPHFTDSDIEQMVQAVIDDDPQAESIRESLTTSLKEVSNAKIARITYPTIVNTRQKTGLSQRQFAEKLGISVNTLKSWEQGQRKPSGAGLALMRLLDKRPELVAELG